MCFMHVTPNMGGRRDGCTCNPAGVVKRGLHRAAPASSTGQQPLLLTLHDQWTWKEGLKL